MVMRIGGLASGMDIDSIVENLMKVERMGIDKVNQDKVLSEWQREAYNDVNKLLAEFVLNTRRSFGLTTTSNGIIQSKSVSSLDWIKSATIDKSDVAEVKARSNAINGDYEIFVHNLASNWSAASSESISIGDRSNLASQFQLSEGDKIDFSITTNKGQVDIKIDDIAGTSINDVVKKINTADIGVTAIYDPSIDRFFLQTNDTGEYNTIKITKGTEDSVDFIDKLKLKFDRDGTMNDVAVGQEYGGTNAIIDFGAAKGISKSSNQFTINNIDFNLKGVSQEDNKAVVRVNADENAIVGEVKEFIEQFNKLIDEIGGKISEKRYNDYPPLTKDQRDSMSDKEIELWEEKSRSGLLRNDAILNTTLQKIRTGLYENVKGVLGSISHLTNIGIETEGYSSRAVGGKLKLDEDKLRSAIREDVDGVVELLFKEPDSSISSQSEKRANTGLIGRMYGDMIAGMKEIIAKAGPGNDAHLYRNINSTMLIDFVVDHSSISMLDKNITGYEKRILELERRLMDKENSYWQKFVAMERALSAMNSQGDWLAQQFGGGMMF